MNHIKNTVVAVAAAALPESIVQYVVRTQESVILDDASAQHPFAADAYVRERHAHSVLCVPLLDDGALRAWVPERSGVPACDD